MDNSHNNGEAPQENQKITKIGDGNVDILISRDEDKLVFHIPLGPHGEDPDLNEILTFTVSMEFAIPLHSFLKDEIEDYLINS
jgi:hypothetical protein